METVVLYLLAVLFLVMARYTYVVQIKLRKENEDLRKIIKEFENEDTFMITKYSLFVKNFCKSFATDLAYNVIAINGEAGEIAEWYKKYICRKNPGNKLSKEDLLSELGDVLWYLVNIAHLNGWTLTEVCKFNMNKLETRYQSGNSWRNNAKK